MRTLTIRFTVDWPEYQDKADICDELLLEDIVGEVPAGVSWEIVKDADK